jgi:hypothetical protein
MLAPSDGKAENSKRALIPFRRRRMAVSIFMKHWPAQGERRRRYFRIKQVEANEIFLKTIQYVVNELGTFNVFVRLQISRGFANATMINIRPIKLCERSFVRAGLEKGVEEVNWRKTFNQSPIKFWLNKFPCNA